MVGHLFKNFKGLPLWVYHHLLANDRAWRSSPEALNLNLIVTLDKQFNIPLKDAVKKPPLKLKFYFKSELSRL